MKGCCMWVIQGGCPPEIVLHNGSRMWSLSTKDMVLRCIKIYCMYNIKYRLAFLIGCPPIFFGSFWQGKIDIFWIRQDNHTPYPFDHCFQQEWPQKWRWNHFQYLYTIFLFAPFCQHRFTPFEAEKWPRFNVRFLEHNSADFSSWMCCSMPRTAWKWNLLCWEDRQWLSSTNWQLVKRLSFCSRTAGSGGSLCQGLEGYFFSSFVQSGPSIKVPKKGGTMAFLVALLFFFFKHRLRSFPWYLTDLFVNTSAGDFTRSSANPKGVTSAARSWVYLVCWPP